MKATGPGGQNVNKRETAVRVIHEPSGAVGECREERQQLRNKKTAFRRMVETPKFQLWLRLQLGYLAAAEDRATRTADGIDPAEVKVEVRRGGRWVELGPTEVLT